MTMGIWNILYIAGSFCKLAGVCLYITEWEAAKYLFLCGAVVVAAVKVKGFSADINDKTLKRLKAQQMFAEFVYILSGVFMLSGRPGNEWLACFLIATLIELYTSFRISYIEKKEKS